MMAQKNVNMVGGFNEQAVAMQTTAGKAPDQKREAARQQFADELIKALNGEGRWHQDSQSAVYIKCPNLNYLSILAKNAGLKLVRLPARLSPDAEATAYAHGREVNAWFEQSIAANKKPDDKKAQKNRGAKLTASDSRGYGPWVLVFDHDRNELVVLNNERGDWLLPNI